jgi:hypothetical protein
MYHNGACMMTNPASGSRKSFHSLTGSLLILLLLLPVTVNAQDPVDLTFGETGAFPWTISGILPGDHGSDFVDLHNNGSESGVVYIWVDNISQFDKYGNTGGGLANYMYFNVSHPNLNSTVILPAHITTFPTAPLLPAYITINQFNAGQTIRLRWTWEFTETGQPQNDAQGNTLRFNISYMLVNFSAPVLPTINPTIAPIVTGGGFPRLAKDPSGLLSGNLPRLNPVQRPLLEAPPQEPPSTEESPAVLPNHGIIMVVAFMVLAIAVLLVSQRKKHPEWKVAAEIFWAIGTVVMVIGIIWQAYLISLQGGRHLTGIHAVAGIVAAIFIISGLVFWVRDRKRPERTDENLVWILVIGVVIILASMLLGFWTVGIS